VIILKDNRLFQISAAYCLALKYNRIFKIFPKFIENNTHDSDDYFKSIFKNFHRDSDYNLGIYKIYQENPEDFSTFREIPISNFNETLILSGYFQNEKYFYNYEYELKRLFYPSNDTLIYLQNKYQNLDRAIFLHSRKGDFITIPFHCIDMKNYYSNALKYLRKQLNISEIVFYIFSDDIELTRNEKIIPENLNHIYIEENSINSLYLMSMCMIGGICPNSSFSWWGSYLNMNPNKIVIFPNKWLNGNYPIDIYYKNSIILPVESN